MKDEWFNFDCRTILYTNTSDLIQMKLEQVIKFTLYNPPGERPPFGIENLLKMVRVVFSGQILRSGMCYPTFFFPIPFHLVANLPPSGML